MTEWADITPGHGSGKVQLDAPKPNRRRKRDWQGIAGLALTVVTLIVGIVIWATAQLESKASVVDLAVVSVRVTTAELRLERARADDRWIMATLSQLAARQGVFIPPMPMDGP
jgi:hypothetical protein